MNKYPLKISCIIPFYNEGRRIFHVLDCIKPLSDRLEVVCVDDGSTDRPDHQTLRILYPEVKFIRLGKNSGKTNAIKIGLQEVTHDRVLLLDADLMNLCYKELSGAIEFLELAPEIDMMILRRVNAPWYLKMQRIDILFTGERIMRTKDLKEILQSRVKGYELEMAINIHMQKNDKMVKWYPSSAINTFKIMKEGLFKGLILEVKMFMNVISYGGLYNFTKLMIGFGRDGCEEKNIDIKKAS